MAPQLPSAAREWLAKIGSKGGSSTSPAKRAAARANGKKRAKKRPTP